MTDEAQGSLSTNIPHVEVPPNSVKPSDIPGFYWNKAREVAQRWYHEEWDETEDIEWQLVRMIAEALVSAREGIGW